MPPEDSLSTGPQISTAVQKRLSPNDSLNQSHSKRAKYAFAACNDCKRYKVKCILLDGDSICQRCAVMGTQCVITPTAAQIAKEKERRAQSTCSSRCEELTEEISILRRQMDELTATVSTLVEKQSSIPESPNRRTPGSESSASLNAYGKNHRDDKLRQPSFVGPTRSTFGFHVAETSLARMGIPTDQDRSTIPPPSPSTRDATPTQVAEQRPSYTPVAPGDDVVLGFSEAEILRLLDIYQVDVISVHRILDVNHLIKNLSLLLNMARQPLVSLNASSKLGKKDLHLLRVAIATAITHEVHGKHAVRDKLIGTVDDDLGRITSAVNVDIKDIQIMGMLSIYFFHTEEELFGWRAIGRAVRYALELGLNHRRSLFDNFPDPDSRKMATQIFWTVYQLDRRWSFGTSLSFALNDKDIDLDLPEPGLDLPYLRCMVAYGRLCSKVWEALPPYGSNSQRIPQETEEYLDFIAQNWRNSIPEELRYRCNMDEYSTQTSAQPRILHRLRTLTRLRENYMRLLIHRHHVLDYENKNPNTNMVQLVVDVAKDSIQVLVNLDKTSDIYRCQPSVYHHYLISALSVLLLAVCHAPTEFTETCRLSFVAAVELLKSLSHHGTASRRLWKSIHGILPFIRSLNLRKDQDTEKRQVEPFHALNTEQLVLQQSRTGPPQHIIPSDAHIDMAHKTWQENAPNLELWPGTEPNIDNIGTDLMNIYDAFGANVVDGQSLQYDIAPDNFGTQASSSWDLAEISRHFEGLI